MGQEGQKNTSDTSGGEKRPWEVVPSDNNQQLTREEILAKREEKRVKRNTKVKESIKWTKKHIMLLIGAVLLIIALIVGGVILVTWLTGNNTKEDSNENAITMGYIEGMTIQNAATNEYAYIYARDVMKEEILKGVYVENTKDIIQYKLEDNVDAYINKITDEYFKIYYTIIGIDLLSNYGYTDRAEYLLTIFDENKYNLDNKQEFAYLSMLVTYYYSINDKEKFEEARKTLDEKYPPEFIDYDTGTAITDEDKLKEIKNDFDNRGKNE